MVGAGGINPEGLLGKEDNPYYPLVILRTAYFLTPIGRLRN